MQESGYNKNQGRSGGYNKKYTIWIVLGIIALILLVNYNGIVKAEKNAEGQWANVETAYQRRADLIPNLVNTVKGYAEYEQETMTEVVNARAKATSINIDPTKLDAASIQKFQQAQQGLSSALGRLLVTVEKYPDLKANANFVDLQAQLEGTENRISVERMKFNNAVRTFNGKLRKVPGVFMNNLYGFEPKGYFKADEGTDKAPEVQF